MVLFWQAFFGGFSVTPHGQAIGLIDATKRINRHTIHSLPSSDANDNSNSGASIDVDGAYLRVETTRLSPHVGTTMQDEDERLAMMLNDEDLAYQLSREEEEGEAPPFVLCDHLGCRQQV